MVTETTVRKTFKEAGFQFSVVSSDSTMRKTTVTNEDVVVQENARLDELNKVLKHVIIGGDIMSAMDFVMSL